MPYLRPSFFIIGERKCGTSSLYRYLIAHPNVLPCALKEPNFFGKGSAHVEQYIQDYWQLFPKQNAKEAIKFDWPELNEAGILYHDKVIIPREAGKKYITGEASVNTFYEVDPSLVHQYLPEVKLIVLLRDPVVRAFSHHRMYQRFQAEGRDLGFRVNDFAIDIKAEMATVKNGMKGLYLTPSIYLPQLKAWTKVYGKKQIRVYFAEELATIAIGKRIMTDIQSYLQLPFFNYQAILKQRFNVAPKAKMDRNLEAQLKAFFQTPNQELEDYLERRLPSEWN